MDQPQLLLLVFHLVSDPGLLLFSVLRVKLRVVTTVAVPPEMDHASFQAGLCLLDLEASFPLPHSRSWVPSASGGPSSTMLSNACVPTCVLCA